MPRKYGISAPVRNIESLQRTGAQLKDAVEAILGYRGTLYGDVELPTPPGSGPGFDFEKLLLYLQDLEERVQGLRVDVDFLFDWVYAHGFLAALPFFWNPGVTTPTPATRLPIDTVSHISNMLHPDDFGFVPAYRADYLLNVDVRFEPDQNNRDWTIAPFDNGVQVGPGISFNSRSEPLLVVSGMIGVPLDPGDVLDVRLWPSVGSSTGDVLQYRFDITARGIAEEDVF